ncbi:MAG: DUF6183 family protein [Polyangiales bacterium]
MNGSRSVASVLAALEVEPARVAWSELYGAVQDAHGRRDVAWLAALLDGLPPASGGAWSAHQHLGQSARRALATVPTYEAAYALLTRAAACTQRPVLAAALAQTHRDDSLARLAALTWRARGAAEMLALWMHESVYLGDAPDAVDALNALQRRLFDAGDALGRAPLTLLPLERRLPRVAPHISAHSWGAWRVGEGSPPETLDPRPAMTLPVTEVTEPAWVERVREAWVPRGTVSNAKVEARRFRLGRPLDPEALGAPVLRAVTPACIGDAADDDDPAPAPREITLSTAPASPEVLAGALLTAAIGLRCYGEYAGVGRGRPRGWRALAALCGLDDAAPWSSVGDALDTLRVACFSADARWFDHVCEDHGFLILDAPGTTLTLVAETDSD